ncbi:DUF3800 domain-containing protein [Futiania mangrovi]|uniref:DUF3800 domain-containing protein n=1 Tax=Futiania mangrovi TaxID=2959716 RepID=A0A9J6PG46_9PROT|nr:DUF3800 domain-containing protein [Futiania mangrovii]MCP1337454.1 DUF3800 domain-containing protein [Futiania mangrovii]
MKGEYVDASTTRLVAATLVTVYRSFMHSFIAFIDESGDDGLRNFRRPGVAGGASTFLTICACLIRATNDVETVQWRDEIKEGSGKRSKGRDIHFADFNHAQKRFACQKIQSLPLRYIAAISHKPSIPEGTYNTKNALYFYMTRYVIERISWFCRDMRPTVREGDGRVKIVFSRRGGMSYEDFKKYLEILKQSPQNSIHWPVIDIESIKAEDHSRVAGLQLADCGASAFSCALEPDTFGNVESQYLAILKRNIYSKNGNFLSYGFKLFPNFQGIDLSEDQICSINLLR